MTRRNPKVASARTPAYPMRLYQDTDSGDWVAEVVDLPGCIGVGESPEAAVAQATVAVAHWVDEAQELGLNVPAPSRAPRASGRVLLRLPKSLHAQLQVVAELEGTSLNQVMVSLLSQALGLRQGHSVPPRVNEGAAAGPLPKPKTLDAPGGRRKVAVKSTDR
ncbi:MAG: type II toxin-antitoxin system HicB family antitoxin [Thermoanaerobaculum sp.]